MSLIDLQREYFLHTLNSIQTAHNLKILVIDAAADHYIKSMFTGNELLNYVTAVEKIENKRSNQCQVDAIYLVKPTKFNINCMDVDFSNQPARYKSCHILFLPVFTEDMQYHFKSKRAISTYMKSMIEIPWGMYPKEECLFLTNDLDQPIQIFYNPQCRSLVELALRKTVQSLLNVCITTGEYPIVRYSNKREDFPPSVLPGKLAHAFQAALDNYCRENTDFPPPSTRPRALMIITDRCLDLMTPLLHDFTYQSLAYDVSSAIKNDVYTYEAENEKGEVEVKTSVLNDYDPDWVDLRHQHIVDASQLLQSKINELIAKNPLLVNRDNVKNTTDLLSVVAHLGGFDEERRRLTLHKKLVDECLNINDTRKLAEYAELEQIVAGYGNDGEGEKVKHIANQLLDQLLKPEPQLTDKLRYIMEYALYRGGLIEQDLVKLLCFIGIEAGHKFHQNFMTLFRNFEHMGFKLIKSSSKPNKNQFYHENVYNDPEVYNTSRYIAPISANLSKALFNQLSEEEFPYTKDRPVEDEPMQDMTSGSLRNPRHKAAWAKKTTTRAPRQRLMYYITGGITYAESKAAVDLGIKMDRDVYVGSDKIISPLQFMSELENLTKERAALRLRDDMREDEKPPSHLYDIPVATPSSQHVHRAPANQTTRQIIPPKKEPVEEKKKSKFKKFFK